MNLVRKVISLKAVALFFAGFISVPTAAQEKIVPKHFREKPLRTSLLVPQRHQWVHLGGAAGGYQTCRMSPTGQKNPTGENS